MELSSSLSSMRVLDPRYRKPSSYDQWLVPIQDLQLCYLVSMLLLMSYLSIFNAVRSIVLLLSSSDFFFLFYFLNIHNLFWRNYVNKRTLKNTVWTRVHSIEFKLTIFFSQLRYSLPFFLKRLSKIVILAWNMATFRFRDN